MTGTLFRLNEFIRPTDRRAVIVDTSAGAVLGALPGLEDFASAIKPILPLADGLVCSAGQLRRLAGTTRRDAALLMRMDWTNTLRPAHFVTPPEQPNFLPLFTAQDALDFGAAGMVTSFLLGYPEEIEAACLKSTVTLALEGRDLGLPLVVEVRPTGPRVTLPGKAVELGASYALEGGADVVAVPYPGRESLVTLGKMLTIPWLVVPTRLDQAAAELDQALDCGASGLWLGYTLFALSAPAAALAALTGQVHPNEQVQA
jgi:DhnA family fructose-bisphosphate aldolase class Ia